MTQVYSLGAVGDRELVVSKTEEDVSVTIWQKDSDVKRIEMTPNRLVSTINCFLSIMYFSLSFIHQFGL